MVCATTCMREKVLKLHYGISDYYYEVSSSRIDSYTSFNASTASKTTKTCSCPCTKSKTSKTSKNMTSTELKVRLHDLRQELHVNIKDTKSYRSKKASADDNRVSSKYIGLIACVVISLPIAFVISIDIINIIHAKS